MSYSRHPVQGVDWEAASVSLSHMRSNRGIDRGIGSGVAEDESMSSDEQETNGR
jgi:hypothetical protein